MAVSDYSTNPASNTTISGIFIGEGCAPASINNAMRQMMADIRVMYNNTPSTVNFMPKSGGAFTGNPTFSGRGGYYHNTDASATSGRITVQAEGVGLPAGSTGDLVFTY